MSHLFYPLIMLNLGTNISLLIILIVLVILLLPKKLCGQKLNKKKHLHVFIFIIYSVFIMKVVYQNIINRINLRFTMHTILNLDFHDF